MANTYTKLTLTGLDWDALKTNLQTWLQGQSQFSDYNFAGSSLSQLLNILTTNANMLAKYLNFVSAEMFLDSAVLYQNIVSHAKLLAYVPLSATPDQAVVNVVVTKAATDNTTTLSLPAFTTFASSPLNGQSYNFVTVDSQTVANVGNTFTFANVALYEGQATSKVFIQDNNLNPSQMFDLSDANVATSTIQVLVQPSNTNPTITVFELATDATNVGPTSPVYYLDMGTNGNYQIYFGDGIIGQNLSQGNQITINYVQTSGGGAAGVSTFALGTPLLSGSTTNVSTVTAAAGGSPPETGLSIKTNAPLSYSAQNRAVTVPDYTAIINKYYPYFQSVNVWGGNQANPPVYGTVFVTAVPMSGYAITQAQQQYVLNTILASLGMLTVNGQWVNADYDYLNFRTTVYYDSTASQWTPNQIQQIVTTAVSNWANTNLNLFNATFLSSNLGSAIDSADPSIEGNDLAVFVQKRFNPVFNVATNYTLTFNTELYNSGGIGPNKLYSAPTFTQLDQTGVPRQCYIAEAPGSSTGIEAINIVTPGSGYTVAPTLTIIGDGEGANAYAVIVNGAVQSVVIDQAGADYTTAQIIATGNALTTATFSAVIQYNTGSLQSYYFANNNVKTVLTANVGTIDYANGIITLSEFAPINISNNVPTLSLYCQPLSPTFGTTLNQILTWDPTDPHALTITVNSTD